MRVFFRCGKGTTRPSAGRFDAAQHARRSLRPSRPGRVSDVFSFIQARENVTFMESMRLLADRAGIDLGVVERSGDSAGPGRVEVAKVNEWAARFFRKNLLDPSLGASTRKYVADRNISDELAEQFELGLAMEGGASLVDAARQAGYDVATLIAADLMRRGEDGSTYQTFRKRLIFPIRDVMRRVIGFGGRTLADDRAKYLNTRQNVLFDKGRSLYGIDRARDAIVSSGRTVVVEGYTDCIAAHQAGFPETVATLGTALTDSHVELLRRYADQAIFLFDSDQAGDDAADRAIKVALPRCLGCRLARIPDGKDPSEFLAANSQSAFSDVLNLARDALEFKWVQIESRFRAGVSDAHRREAILDFLRIVAEGADGKAVDAIQRGLLVNQVAHLLRMDRAEIDAMLLRLKPRRAAVRPGAESGRPGAPSGRPAAANVPRLSGEVEEGAQRDWVRVLEVILNEPGLLAVIGELPELGGITDPRDRRIAEVAFGLAARLGSFRMVDVLGELPDPEDVSRVAELAQRGAQRNRYEAELRDAFGRIRRRQATGELESAKRRLLNPEKGDGALAPESVESAALKDGMEGHRHFAPLRLRRKAGAGGGIGV